MKRKQKQRSILPHIILCVGWLTLSHILLAAGVVDIGQSSEVRNIIKPGRLNGDFLFVVRELFLQLLSFARIALNGVALLGLLYVGFIWVTSMGEEEKQTDWKMRIGLILMGLFLINIPEIIYRIFTGSDYDTVGFGAKISQANIAYTSSSWAINQSDLSRCNIFFCPQNFWWNGSVVAIMKVLEMSMIAAAVIMFSIGGFMLFFGGGSEEKSDAAKKRIGYGIVALIFTGFIEGIYRAIIFGGSLTAATNGLIRTVVSIANFFLFLAGPIAILYIILWGYYYITSAGDEEKADRGKKILLYTFFATIILILGYTFLLEIVGLNLF